MFKFCIILLFFLSSCSYPDIDTVPNFNNMNMTMQDAIELCKISNSDNGQIAKCFEQLNEITNRLWINQKKLIFA